MINLPGFGQEDFIAFNDHVIELPDKVLDPEFPTLFVYEAELFVDASGKSGLRDGDSGKFWVKIPNWYENEADPYEEILIELRGYRFDTHEMRKRYPKSVRKRYSKEELKAMRAKERKLAIRDRNFVENLLLNKRFVIIYRHKHFNYRYGKGRWVVTFLFEDGETLKEKLEAKGYTTGKYTDK